jgi:hypothetical protein
MEVDCEPGSKQTIEVFAAGKQLFQGSFKAGETANKWSTATLDLSPYAGQSLLLAIVQNPGGSCWAYWKRLEITHEP